MKLLLPLFALMLLAACSADHYEAKARIIERRIISESDILIKYAFTAGNETIIDSVRTRNKVIPHDSLVVRYSASDPRKNTLKF